MPTLEELVVAARSGDQQAFAALIDAEGPTAYRLARAVLASSADAEEAVQDAFLKAWRHLPKLREPAHWSAWFRQIAVRSAVDRARRRPRVRELVLEDHEPLAQSDMAQSVADRDGVVRVLVGLSPEDRALLGLRYLLDLELPDVAATLRIPLGTAKSRLHRLLARLKSELGPDQ